ncbi:MAG: TlyA family RNA methyltransferase, partial [Moorella sp. (in: Bacteria)]|nr:TlyA family RNA methyltransferase [Moorella sp. (in: firmicutes)]
MAKQRLDLLLVARGFFPSRQQARAAIMAGEVLVNDVPVDKPGTAVPRDAEIRLTGRPLPYVSRGGLKLEKALQVFNIDLRGKIVLDVGASTGGFTDCALHYGAARVYAVDVGYGQLAWPLRQDCRVIVLERTNARYLEPG